ncbi:MAG TPA: SCO family protein [Marmoricola sp.]
MREPMRRGAALLGGIALVIVLAGCGGSSSGAYTGRVIDPPFTVPAVSLTDNTGSAFTLAKDDRDLDIVFFGYTFCPDICKFVMSQLTSAYLHLPSADRDRIRVVFVTTDPARDDPATLTRYLKRYDSHFLGLTGTLPQLQQVAKPLGIFFKKGEKLSSGGYAVEHTSHVYALAGDKARLLWSGDTSATHIAADIKRLLDDEAA